MEVITTTATTVERLERPKRQYTIRVFYGTSRGRTGKDKAESFYGFNDARRLELGVCWVSIPPNHAPGLIDSPAWTHAEFRRDPAKHMVLTTVLPVSSADYFRRMKTTVERSEKKELFIFVHGFNNTFEEAALRTAELFHDLDFQGAPVFFSWPSRGGAATGVLAYRRDRREAAEAAKYLRQFLDTVADNSGAEVIHLIVHSMGNFVFQQALEDGQQHLKPLRWRKAKLHEVALAAADLDARGIQKLSRALRESTPAGQLRITSYASSGDLALQASVQANDGAQPFGLIVSGEPRTLSGVDVIDASELLTDMIGHVYWVAHRLGLGDLRELVIDELPPQLRGLSQPMGKGWWRFVAPPP
jgi:esterase/lipase superfamily enzyme